MRRILLASLVAALLPLVLCRQNGFAAFGNGSAIYGNDPVDVDPIDDPLEHVDEVAQHVLVLIGLVTLTMIINNFIQQRGVPIPEALCTVAIGIIAGCVISFIPNMGNDAIENLESASASQFLILFIAPIIFAAGYGLESEQFFENFTRIAAQAFFGTIVASVITGAGLFYLPPLTGLSDENKLTWAEALAFGALISSTDPVALIAIFKHEGMVETGLGYLYYTVLGESILSDAVCITVFDSLAEIVKEDEEVNGRAIAKIVLTFFITLFGSIAIGVVCGLLTAGILKVSRFAADAHGGHDEDLEFNVPELGVALFCGYMPFLIASAAKLSGIVAIMFAGITMRNFAHYNMTKVTRQVFLPVNEFLAHLSETYTCLLLGLGFFLDNSNYSVSFIAWTLFFCLFARLQVYPVSWMVNKISGGPRLNIREQTVLWCAGLRGCVAFMLAVSFPQAAHMTEHHHRKLILCTTRVVVGATLLGFAWPTTFFLRLLDIKPREDSRIILDMTDGADGADGGRDTPGGTPGRRQSWLATPRASLMALGRRSSGHIHVHLQRLLMTSNAIAERDAHHHYERSSIRSILESIRSRLQLESSAPIVAPEVRQEAIGAELSNSIGGSPREPLTSAAANAATAAEDPGGVNQLGIPDHTSSRVPRPSAPGRLQGETAVGTGTDFGATQASRPSDPTRPPRTSDPTRQQMAHPRRRFVMLINP